MGDLPLCGGSFDAITAYHSLIHVPCGEHRAVVDEFARVLRPGGRLLLSEGLHEWSGTNPDWLDAGVEMQWYIAGIETTRDQLRNAGFVVEEEWRIGDSLDDGNEGHWAFVSARLDR